MTWEFRPAVRQNTPLVIGLAGPTKSGKTMSALELATGLANGGPVAMICTEGPRGHQYADTYKYVACDLTPPFSPGRYLEVIEAAGTLKPAALIIDSATHMHDGPGGLLEMHETELNRMAGSDEGKRGRVTWAAWIRPKAEENKCVYGMLALACPVILCFRAKEKLKITPGKDPINLGWQPIAGERIAFETIFTLTFEPHCKGVPSLDISDMRSPFDTLIPAGKRIDAALGRTLAEWARGLAQPADRGAIMESIRIALAAWPSQPHGELWAAICLDVCGTCDLEKADVAALSDLLTVARTYPDPKSPARHLVNGLARKLKGTAA